MASLFALITHSHHVSSSELYYMAAALEINARHCAAAWRREAPAVVVCDHESKLPGWASPVLFVDGTSDAGFLAEHYYDPQRPGPAARVFCDQSSGIREGSNSLCESAAHEILESMIDPMVNLWMDAPGRPGAQMALEICDPVQNHYLVGSDKLWPVANFVLPAYYRPGTTGLPYDHKGTLHAPGAIGNEGYTVLRDQHGAWAENRDGRMSGFAGRPGKSHPMARTFLRGVKL